jgi:hypothetical protein
VVTTVPVAAGLLGGAEVVESVVEVGGVDSVAGGDPLVSARRSPVVSVDEAHPASAKTRLSPAASDVDLTT